MTLSIDDLVQKFIWANDSGVKAGSLTPNTTPEERLERRMEAARAGIRAVIEALRDEICNGYAENSARDLANTFNEILAPRGDEAAGGSTPGERLVKAAHEAAAIARGEKEPAAVHTPAAAPDDVEAAR